MRGFSGRFIALTCEKSGTYTPRNSGSRRRGRRVFLNQEASMPFEDVKKIWMNGQFVDFADAKVHVLTHAIHYGSGLFEGIRCYVTKNEGPAIFRLHEHARRLYDSARIYRMDVP